MRALFVSLWIILISFSSTMSAEWKITDLDNGLKVMILENHQVPQVNISTTVKVGAKNENDYYNGATHLLEHLILFRGTEKMTGEQVGDAMKSHGAYFNGWTNTDWTDFVVALPSDYLEFGLEIHADMLFRSNFSAQAMDEERQAVLEEINISEDRPSSIGYYSMMTALFQNHPYQRTVLGTKERISNVSRDSVYAYYKRYYAPNNMTMAIVGDIDAEKTLELVKKYFAAFFKGDTPPDQYRNPPSPLTEIKRIEIKKDIGQAYFLMGMVGPRIDSPDQYACDLLATMLGGGKSSRLYRKLKNELGLVYNASFGFLTLKYEGPMMVNAELDPANLTKVETAILEILKEAKEKGFSETELRKAKNTIKTDYFTSHESGLDIANDYARYNCNIGYAFIQNYPQMIEKTTMADIQAVANKYLNATSYVITTVVPQ
jgi:zinc protease